MKKYILLLVLSVCAVSMWAQESSSKVQFHSASIGLGVSFYEDLTAISGNLDLGINIGKHQIKAFVLASTYESGALGAPLKKQIRTEEYDLLYGREFKIVDKIYFDGYAGVGLFVLERGKRSQGTHTQENTIGFPLLARGRFQASQLIGFGLQLHSNINSVQSIFGGGFFLQFKF